MKKKKVTFWDVEKVINHLRPKKVNDNSDDGCYHEYPICGWRCNCSDQPCSHCKNKNK